jgi:hypothetical protein
MIIGYNDTTAYIVQTFRPRTIPAIEWIQKSDGYWAGYDRGASEDIFEADVLFFGTQTEIGNLEAEIADETTGAGGNTNQREAIAMTLGAGEEIFGADIDYSGELSVVPVIYGPITRNNFSSFQMPARFRLVSPGYTGSASFSDLRIADNSYNAYSEFDMRHIFACDGTSYYQERRTDPGIFEAVFRQTFEEMKAIRRYLLTTARSNAISYPSFGVTKPYGDRM